VVEFLGRIDRQVKIRGFRVEPGEVEHALCEHPAVREAVVVPRTHGPGDTRLLAYLTPADVPVDAVREFLAQRLPAYEIPAAWIPLAQLPLTPNGKVDRDALPQPSAIRPDQPRPARPPTPVEQRVIEIWEQLLEVHPIHPHDDFFDLGGHSLLATRLATLLHDTFDVDVQLRQIFEHPTVEALATTIEHAPPIQPETVDLRTSPVPRLDRSRSPVSASALDRSPRP